MAVTIPSPITGGAQTGFTSPTYTNSVDSAVAITAKQVAVTAAGGTQVGVTTHTIGSPFTLSVQRPASYKQLGAPNPVTGKVSSFPRNTSKVITRKGMSVLANQPIQTGTMSTEIVIPAGADTYDVANVRAMISAHIGLLTAVSAGLGDLAITGLLN